MSNPTLHNSSNTINQLLEAVETTVIPGSPPRLSKIDAEIGLSFLETVLRQNHTRRIREEIVLQSATYAQRTVKQDLSLRKLSDAQRSYGAEYSRLRSNTAFSSADLQTSPIWVPICRIDRRLAPPVQIQTQAGISLPTLTRSESSLLFGPALYRIIRNILQVSRTLDTSGKISKLLDRENEARWLLQQSIVSLVAERAPATRRRTHDRYANLGRASAGRQRGLLKECLRFLEDSGQIQRFLELLNIAMNDQIVIVAIDPTVAECQLSYQLPVVRADDTANLTNRWSQLRKKSTKYLRSVTNSEFVASYQTVIPPGIESYHLSASVTDGSDVIAAVLQVDSGSTEIANLSQDLRYLAGQKEQFDNRALTDAETKLAEYHLQKAVKSLAELTRRRIWEADWQGTSIEESRLTETVGLAEAAFSGTGLVDVENPNKAHASLLTHPDATPHNLRAAADEIVRADMGIEIVSDLAPSGSTAHVNWRRREVRRYFDDDVHAECVLRIVNGGVTQLASVAFFGVIMIVLSLAIGAFTFGSPFPWTWFNETEVTDIGAKVAILFLLPGFLYTRLNLPRRGSVAAVLLVWPRLAAYTLIGSTVVMALGLVSASWPVAAIACWMALLLQTASMGGLLLLPRLFKNTKGVQGSGATWHLRPWLSESRYFPRSRSLNVRFYAVESQGSST